MQKQPHYENIKISRLVCTHFLISQDVGLLHSTGFFIMNSDIFIPIIEYENIYSINCVGTIKSIRPKPQRPYYKRKDPERKLKPGINSGGYKVVSLFKNGIAKQYYIHRLVAIHFISNPNNLPEVNHKDGDKSNNHVSNIEWCTHKTNIEHARDVLGSYYRNTNATK